MNCCSNCSASRAGAGPGVATSGSVASLSLALENCCCLLLTRPLLTRFTSPQFTTGPVTPIFSCPQKSPVGSYRCVRRLPQ